MGAGVLKKATTARQLQSLVPSGVKLIPHGVSSFDPDSSSLTTTEGSKYSYNFLVVAAGIQINWGAIAGLEEALKTPYVGSVYSYNTADKVWSRGGRWEERFGLGLLLELCLTNIVGVLCVVVCAGGGLLLVSGYEH